MRLATPAGKLRCNLGLTGSDLRILAFDGSSTNIEAYAKAVISTAIHPCHFRQSIRFDVGPPFVGREPATRSTEELLAGGLVRAPAGGSI